MKFNLIDSIEVLEPDRIVGCKQVSLAEEYLADHFPGFPVLPGVLMLEALTQAAGWLLHYRRDFACSMAVLREARNVKYGRFVPPGSALRVEARLLRLTETGARFEGAGTVGGQQAVSARVELAYFNLSEREPELAEVDRRLRQHHRQQWSLIAPRASGVPFAL